jgi:hypothetical protein
VLLKRWSNALFYPGGHLRRGPTSRCEHNSDERGENIVGVHRLNFENAYQEVTQPALAESTRLHWTLLSPRERLSTPTEKTQLVSIQSPPTVRATNRMSARGTARGMLKPEKKKP